EKHFTLDRQLPGPDHEASLEPDELDRMVEGIRNVEVALGDGRKRPVAEELENRDVVRKSIVVDESVAEGTTLTREHLAFRRPGSGLTPSMIERVTGRVASRDIEAGELLSSEMIRPKD
ncbi:MAG: N-acetylneuraminate synthase family protein, partial [Bradymonadaceae bacterium]